jgi:SET domain-containing protein
MNERRLTAGERVYVNQSCKHGVGVFASSDLPENTTVHIAPVLLLKNNDLDSFNETDAAGYVFTWDENRLAFAMGVGSLFNHSSEKNCLYEMWSIGDVDEVSNFSYPFNALKFITVRDVACGEELTISYGDDVWFEEA